MENAYGPDYMTIVDEDGTEFEIEVLTSLEYNGCTYLAVTPAVSEEDSSEDIEVFVLKSVEDESGEPILCAVEDETEMETVYELLMERLYEDEEGEEDL